MPETKPRVLIVEDDPANRRMLMALLKAEGWTGIPAADGATAMDLARREEPWAALLDLGLPDRPGLDVLRDLRKEHPKLPVIVLTGDTETASAVKALQAGAFNYFTKPIQSEQVLAALRAALEQAGLTRQLAALQRSNAGLARSMGPGPSIARLEEELRKVADSAFSVLVRGETGAGKELVSRAVHDLSPRAAQPFVALDCGAIPENLLESELFGYEKGAFSGADKRKEGHFSLAQGGTLFLDEIGNLPLGLQAKLLRVLQERELRPLGGTKALSLDVRLVAATNLDLAAESEAGRFRSDLYYRLAEFTLQVPALRERPEDLPYLAQRFLEEAAVELRRPVRGLAPGSLALLKAQAWPGNVRQLRNLLRQGLLRCSGPELGPEDLAPLLKRPGAKATDKAGATLKAVAEAAVAAAEGGAIRQALRASRGKILPASRALGVDNKTLHGKLKKYGIRARDYEGGEGA